MRINKSRQDKSIIFFKIPDNFDNFAFFYKNSSWKHIFVKNIHYVGTKFFHYLLFLMIFITL